MTRKFNPKKDQKVIRTIAGESSEILKLRLMLNAFDKNESNGMSRVYSAWSANQKNKSQ